MESRLQECEKCGGEDVYLFNGRVLCTVHMLIYIKEIEEEDKRKNTVFSLVDELNLFCE